MLSKLLVVMFGIAAGARWICDFSTKVKNVSVEEMPVLWLVVAVGVLIHAQVRAMIDLSSQVYRPWEIPVSVSPAPNVVM